MPKESDYSDQDILNMCDAVQDIQFFYRGEFLNYKGPRGKKRGMYSEIVAAWVLKNLDRFEAITPITRSSSYAMEHQAESIRAGVLTERQIALRMYEQGKIDGINGVGKILDYETPLTNPGDQNLKIPGEIDLLAYDQDNQVLRILELKHPNSDETILRCVMEAYTYIKQVDYKKLIEDFNRDKSAGIPEGTKIVACPFVFNFTTDGNESIQHQEYQEMRFGKRPNLKKLIEKLQIEPLIITGDVGN